jgi:hypothetical protein
MTQRRLRLVLVAFLFVRPGAAQAQSRTAGGRPDFGGIWTSATATPLERPATLKNKEFFTPAEAAEWERAKADQAPEPADPVGKTIGTYNKAFFEPGPHVVKTLRTAIITEPSDGRIPALTPVAAAEKLRRQRLLRNPGAARDMGLQDRCLVFPTAVPPMLPYRYNSNYQIVQTEDHLVVLAEMIHDTRIIPLDGRAHLPSSVRLWLGDSVGHWEGETLVVDTANFKDTGGFYGDAGGMFGFDENLHVVERFSFLDADTILYRFEVDDPTAFTRPWKGELTMERAPGAIYEYACHEGNYALPDILKGFRAHERDGDGKEER